MRKALVVLFLILLIGLFALIQHQAQDKYGKALELYRKGDIAEDTFVKDRLLNESLEELLAIHEESSSKNALIGEILARLRQHPLSVYYYLAALEEDPENGEIQRQLKRVIQDGKLPTVIPPFPVLRNAKVVFSFLFLAWVMFLSWALWKDRRGLQKGGFYFAIPLGLFGVYLAARIFFAPIYGVMIHSQGLYQGAGIKEPLLGPIPLPPGVVVIVLGENHEGEWLKIRTGEGVMGYVPEDAIRVLR
jgi:hypothetical protein